MIDSNIKFREFSDELSEFAKASVNDLKVIHLNINSLFIKIDEIHDLLDKKEFDLVFLNETKLDNSVPNSRVAHHAYNIHRRDRDYCDSIGFGRHGGGLLVYSKKYLKCSISIARNFEALKLKLTINKQIINFLACYKSPSIHNKDCIQFLESFISTEDPAEPLFIIGDLNMDTSREKENELNHFIKDNNYTNIVNKPTRIRTCFYKKKPNNKDKIKNTSSTLIDVVIHNGLLDTKSDVIGCPFSDHKFVVASFKLKTKEPTHEIILSRNLSAEKLKLIEEKISKQTFSDIDSSITVDEQWTKLKNNLISIIDEVSPLKQVKLKNKERYPWYDLELNKVKSHRDTSYAKAKQSQLPNDWEIYKDARRNFQKLNKSKIIDYFKDKNASYFKKSKKFWDFYKTSVKLKSDQLITEGPNNILINDHLETDPEEIDTVFNKFFTSIKSLSLSSIDQCNEFIKNHLNELKKDGKINIPESGFKFEKFIVFDVAKH